MTEVQNAEPMQIAVDLAGVWQLAEIEGDHTAPMGVPGDVISALHDAGAIADPYWGRNEYGCRWIAQRDWTITRSFDLPDTDPGAGWYLDLTYLDTVATVRINGTVVLEAANAFRRWRPDVSAALRGGTNTIEIRFHSNPKAGAEILARQPFPVPYEARNSPIPHGNMLRKPQCHFGWDWNIALAPFGLHGEARLCRMAPARIEAVETAQHHDAATGAVTVDVKVTLIGVADATADWRVRFADQERAGTVDVGPTETAVTARFEVTDPQLWQPAGSGDQALYDLEVTAGGDHARRRIGLRTIELVTDPDDAGARFLFRVNGREVFCRGANWIPADALPGRIDREKTADLLRSAVAANMNMIRVWGGGQYEPDWFYDLCDELGLMVWQDFMFACNLYPSTPAFLDEVRAEVREQARRLDWRACLALWCGDNELIGALTWFPESLADRDRYLVSYDRLNRTIEEALKSVAPDARWWPSSPSPGYMNFGDAWHQDGSGDMHFWSVWHEGEDFAHYRSVRPRFCSEFGFQSYPSMAVIRQFADPADMNIASPVMESHQKNRGGNARIAETMFRYFRFPEGFENFVYLSQVQQGLAIRTAVEGWRSLKPHCMGSLIWQLNDTWPVASWASLDYGGGWKALHYMARRFYRPFLVTAVPSADGATIDLFAVNDLDTAASTTVEVEAIDVGGLSLWRRSVEAKVGTEAAMTITGIPAADVPEDAILTWRWTGPDGEICAEHYAPAAYKALSLTDPGLDVNVIVTPDGAEIALTSTALALYVTVEANISGRFSDNVIDLVPGRPIRLGFRSLESGRAPRFTVRHLQSSLTPGPAITA